MARRLILALIMVPLFGQFLRPGLGNQGVQKLMCYVCDSRTLQNLEDKLDCNNEGNYIRDNRTGEKLTRHPHLFNRTDWLRPCFHLSHFTAGLDPPDLPNASSQAYNSLLVRPDWKSRASRDYVGVCRKLVFHSLIHFHNGHYPGTKGWAETNTTTKIWYSETVRYCGWEPRRAEDGDEISDTSRNECRKPMETRKMRVMECGCTNVRELGDTSRKMDGNGEKYKACNGGVRVRRRGRGALGLSLVALTLANFRIKYVINPHFLAE